MSGPQDSGDNGRRPDGRFAPGNALGRGNPQHRRMAELRQAALEAATPEMVEGIIRRLAVQALKEGDTSAARLFLEYALGKPAASVEISGPDGSPLGVMSWVSVQHVLMDALRDYPEAKVRVAERLKGLADAGDRMAGDGA